MERLTNKREADAQREGYERRLANGYPRNIPAERFCASPASAAATSITAASTVAASSATRRTGWNAFPEIPAARR